MEDEARIGEYYTVSLKPYDTGGDADSRLDEARRAYFAGKAAKGVCRVVEDGREGKIRYKLGRNCFRWKKVCGGKTLQEAFSVADGWRLLTHDCEGRLLSSAAYDGGLRWLRTAYYAPGSAAPEAVLSRGEGCLLLRTAAGETKLLPCPWEPGTAGQSLVNAKAGEPRATARAQGGCFCFCPEEERALRFAALRGIRSDPAALRPVWPGADGAEELDFTVTPNDGALSGPCGPDPAGSPGGREAPPRAVHTVHKEAGKPETEESADDYAANREIFACGERPAKYAVAAKGLAGGVRGGPRRGGPPAPSLRIVVGAGESYLYAGRLTDGLRQGRGRTETPAGLTAYEGAYRDDLREGFGVYYYKSGRLAYAGGWKRNLREGLGVAFGAKDGAVFVGNWKANAAAGEGTQFDLSGRPVYSGGWKDGRRSGYGVEFRGGRVWRAGFWRAGEYLGPEDAPAAPGAEKGPGRQE